MNRSALSLGILVGASAATWSFEHAALACGGCFHPPIQSVSDITDERMLLTVSPSQTTLYDQIIYTGQPSSFAWVLPIKGTVSVGLSADVLFDSVDQVTQSQFPAPPPPSCPPPPDCRNAFGAGAASSAGATDASLAIGAPESAVTVNKMENVGPYATVQLHATDPTALETWLQQNGFVIPDDVKPVIAAYLTESFDFLAMKLLPNQGVKAMRPVRVTYPGASLSLPLRMAAVGTGLVTGITIWVVSDGRYEPQNFPFFHIDDGDLVWDWSTSASNYTTLRTEHEATLNNAGWEIESSLTINEQVITNTILGGGQYYGNGGFGGPSLGFGAPATVSDPALDYLPIPASGDAGLLSDAGAPVLSADGGTAGGGGGEAGPAAGGGETAEEVRADDINTLFAGLSGPNVRVTRIRADISHAAMNKDLLLQASSDQSELSNVRSITKSVNFTCPVYSGCQVVGSSYVGPVSDGGNGIAPPPALTPTLGSASGSSGSSLQRSPAYQGSGSCVAGPPSASGRVAGFGALAAGIGLALTRRARSRRRNRR